MPRLQKESKSMESYNENGIRFEMIEPMKKWNAYLSDFNNDTRIYHELQKYNYKEVVMEITITPQYPFTPPFVRVVHPRFKNGGFITAGGSLCVDILTINGWVPSFNMISLMNQLKIFIDTATVHPSKHMVPYTLKTAKKYFNYTTKYHNWDKAE